MSRRVVTGTDAEGASFVVVDEVVAPQSQQGDASTVVLWADDSAPPRTPNDGVPHSDGSWFPAPGGVRVVVAKWPPGLVEVGGDALAEVAADGDERIWGSGPGFHRHDSVDVIVVLSGELELQLDKAVTTLAAGDIVIQNGTAHAWRVPGPEPVEAAFILTGAESDR